MIAVPILEEEARAGGRELEQVDVGGSDKVQELARSRLRAVGFVEPLSMIGREIEASGEGAERERIADLVPFAGEEPLGARRGAVALPENAARTAEVDLAVEDDRPRDLARILDRSVAEAPRPRRGPVADPQPVIGVGRPVRSVRSTPEEEPRASGDHEA